MNWRLLVFLSLTAWLGAAHGATVTVTNDVLQSAANLEPEGFCGFGSQGAVKYAAWNLVIDPIQPITMRKLYHVMGSGSDKGHKYITLDGPSTSLCLVYTTGTFSGATMRAYRLVDKDGNPVPQIQAGWAAGGTIFDDTKVDHVEPLGVTKVLPPGTPDFPLGGWLADTPGAVTYKDWLDMTKDAQQAIMATWRVYYEGDLNLQLDDVVIFERTFVWPDEHVLHPRMTDGKPFRTYWNAANCTEKQVELTEPLPPELQGQEACLALESQDGSNPASIIRGQLFWTQVKSYYGQLEPGVTYRYEAWMRQEGLSSSKVTLGFGSNATANSQGDTTYFGKDIHQDFTVTTSWQRYGFQFTAPPRVDGGPGGMPKITFQGPGKLYLTNIKLMPIYQPGDEDKFFVPNQTILKEMLASQPETGHKGALRISGQTESRMKSFLSGYTDARMGEGLTIGMGRYDEVSLPGSLFFAEATGDSPETRMVPWLIMQVTFSEEEWRNLVEYLAAPYDPVKDTPRDEALRLHTLPATEGGRPWTDDFREVVIELGNENWQNRAMPDWIGFGRFGHIFGDGRAYGAICRHYIEEMKKSPYWNDDLTKKISFSLGSGYYGDYGEHAAEVCGDLVRYIGHATYVGPVNEQGQANVDDAGFQRTLLCYAGAKQVDQFKEWSNAVQKVQAEGISVHLAAYEGGPSGYVIGESPLAKATEVYGKSLAMAVPAFDAEMNADRLGWTYQNFSAFAEGNGWSSHTDLADGFRPSPAWLAMEPMRNRLMRGDMITTQCPDAPTISVDTRSAAEIKANKPIKNKDVEMLGYYAMRNGDYYSVALTSRSLNDPIPVTLALPFNSAQQIDLSYLKGNPRDTNVDDMKVTLEKVSVDPKQLVNGQLVVNDKTGALAGGMPPGTILIYTFTGAK